MITIGLHFGTYLSEVYRGALEGVPKTQWEACRALNFTTLYTYRRIVLPQAFPIAIPGMGNYLVGILKIHHYYQQLVLQNYFMQQQQ
jgi:polar amino acid transport system permease protein